MIAAVFALGSALWWGAGDFTGGLATRRSDALRTVLIGYSVGLVALTIFALVRAEPLPPISDLVWGALAGLCGLVGVSALYRGFATGRMGVIAPISAVLAAGLPVVFNALTAGLPGALQLAGFVLALAGIWLLARPERLSGRPAGLGTAILSGLGFGSFFITLRQVGPEAVFWPLVAGRVASCGVVLTFALITRRWLPLRQSPLRLVALAGTLDALGNLFFLLAIQSGRLDVASVLASLYPAVTTLLARLAIKEHLTRLQMAGVAMAVAAIMLITV